MVWPLFVNILAICTLPFNVARICQRSGDTTAIFVIRSSITIMTPIGRCTTLCTALQHTHSPMQQLLFAINYDYHTLGAVRIVQLALRQISLYVFFSCFEILFLFSGSAHLCPNDWIGSRERLLLFRKHRIRYYMYYIPIRENIEDTRLFLFFALFFFVHKIDCTKISPMLKYARAICACDMQGGKHHATDIRYYSEEIIANNATDTEHYLYSSCCYLFIYIFFVAFFLIKSRMRTIYIHIAILCGGTKLRFSIYFYFLVCFFVVKLLARNMAGMKVNLMVLRV